MATNHLPIVSTTAQESIGSDESEKRSSEPAQRSAAQRSAAETKKERYTSLVRFTLLLSLSISLSFLPSFLPSGQRKPVPPIGVVRPAVRRLTNNSQSRPTDGQTDRRTDGRTRSTDRGLSFSLPLFEYKCQHVLYPLKRTHFSSFAQHRSPLRKKTKSAN